jgi:hypothetical protein
MRNVRRVELPAYRKVEPDFPKFTDLIYNGGIVKVIFDAATFEDDGCGVTGTPMGTLIAKKTYMVHYTKESRSWMTSGPNQARPGCTEISGTGDNIATSPTEHKLVLWGRTFDFDDAGEIFDKNDDSAVGDSQNGLVGHIYER